MSLYSQGLYLGQNSPSRLQLGRHLSLIIVIFLFGLRKWNYYSALSLPTPQFSKVCIYIHAHCGLWSFQIKSQLIKNQRTSIVPVSNLIQAFHGEGLILAQAACCESGHHCINSEVWGCQGGQGYGFCCLSKQMGCISCSQVKGLQPPSHSSLNFQLFP